MFKALLLGLLIATTSLVIAQNQPGQDDDDFLNPEPSVERGNKRGKPRRPRPEGRKDYDEGKVKELLPIELLNYERGKFNHANIFRFCKMVIDQIDNTEKKENKIISISIKGFADGLINNGVRVSRNQVHQECAKFAAFDRGINDIELATLRAC